AALAPRTLASLRLWQAFAGFRGTAAHPRRRASPHYPHRPGRDGPREPTGAGRRGRALLPTDARLRRLVLADLADSQAARNPARPRRTALGGTDGDLDRQTRAEEPPRVVGMGHHSLAHQREELDRPTAKDDAAGEPVSCAAGPRPCGVARGGHAHGSHDRRA